jgi:tetratricopeptide (TPR) repeat protein
MVRARDVMLYEQAIDHFNRLLQQDPSSRNYRHRGIAWLYKEELDIAIGDFNEAIRRDPTSEASFTARGLAWKSKGEYDKAIADHNEAIRLDPELSSEESQWNSIRSQRLQRLGLS